MHKIQLEEQSGVTSAKSTERESKLVSSNALTEADIARMLETVRVIVKWLSTVRQMDTYFDTHDGILLGAGSAFRVRRVANVNRGTFKLPISIQGAFHERQEIEWQIDSNEDRPPSEESSNLLRVPPDVRLALSHLGVRALAPVLFVVTTRHRGEATDDNAEVIAEVALDEVIFIGPRGEARQWEVELEYRAGRTARVEQIEESLIAQGLRPSRSKFAVGMAEVG